MISTSDSAFEPRARGNGACRLVQLATLEERERFATRDRAASRAGSIAYSPRSARTTSPYRANRTSLRIATMSTACNGSPPRGSKTGYRRWICHAISSDIAPTSQSGRTRSAGISAAPLYVLASPSYVRLWLGPRAIGAHSSLGEHDGCASTRCPSSCTVMKLRACSSRIRSEIRIVTERGDLERAGAAAGDNRLGHIFAFAIGAIGKRYLPQHLVGQIDARQRGGIAVHQEDPVAVASRESPCEWIAAAGQARPHRFTRRVVVETREFARGTVEARRHSPVRR